MNESILTWNVTNWITVIIMAAVGFLVIALASQGVKRFATNSTQTQGG